MRVNNHSRDYEGYIPDLVAELSRRLHFEYYLRSARDGQYGQRRPDGTWNGVVGELLTGVNMAQVHRQLPIVYPAIHKKAGINYEGLEDFEN